MACISVIPACTINSNSHARSTRKNVQEARRIRCHAIFNTPIRQLFQFFCAVSETAGYFGRPLSLPATSDNPNSDRSKCSSLSPTRHSEKTDRSELRRSHISEHRSFAAQRGGQLPRAMLLHAVDQPLINRLIANAVRESIHAIARQRLGAFD